MVCPTTFYRHTSFRASFRRKGSREIGVIWSKLWFIQFKESNGWLENCRRRHSFSYNLICGESSFVDIVSVQDRIERIPKIRTKYDKEDIFSCDDTSSFFKDMSNKSFTVEKEECREGKKSKDRVTVLFCVNSVGEKLKPLVIG